MKNLKNLKKKSERGQAIIIIVFAFIGLVAMVGLVTDTGLVLIEYGKLKKAVDAASVAAAQEYRPDPATGDLNTTAIQNAALSFLQLNQSETVNLDNLTIHTCEDVGADRPALCNTDPIGHPEDNRKLVEVTASTNAQLGFLRVLGITDVTLTASSVGEAATIDLVMVMDTSASMAFQTGNETTDTETTSDSDDDPSVCNDDDSCQPMREVKLIAKEFVEKLIYFGYDRVAIITMTSQTPNGDRNPVEVIPLSFTRNDILNGLTDVRVFEPRQCADPYNTDLNEGSCRQYNSGVFANLNCPIWENQPNLATQNPSSCPSSNIGGAMWKAEIALKGSNGATEMRTQSLWVVVALLGGPANATDTPSGSPADEFKNGYCPLNTFYTYTPYFEGPSWCRDSSPSSRHSFGDEISYTHPITGEVSDISIYDASDYAKDKADNLAAAKTNSGVTIYTIGLGKQIQSRPKDRFGVEYSVADEPYSHAEELLRYIALEAGDGLNPDINHGQYFYAPKSTSLSTIFDLIAQNIVTKISQ